MPKDATKKPKGRMLASAVATASRRASGSVVASGAITANVSSSVHLQRDKYSNILNRIH
jgi:hypothetical protein